MKSRGFKTVRTPNTYELIDTIMIGDADKAAYLMDQHIAHIEDKLDLNEQTDQTNLSDIFTTTTN